MKVLQQGSAHNGLAEWYWQRASAMGLILLLPFAAILLLLVEEGAIDHQGLVQWLQDPWVRVIHSLLIVALLLHAFFGVKVIVEDYVHLPCMRIPIVLSALGLALAGGIYGLALVWGLT